MTSHPIFAPETRRVKINAAPLQHPATPTYIGKNGIESNCAKLISPSNGFAP